MGVCGMICGQLVITQLPTGLADSDIDCDRNGAI